MEDASTPQELPRKRKSSSTKAACSVPCCSQRGIDKDVHFHSFPVNFEVRAKWIQAIRREEGPTFEIRKGSTFVCSSHFLPSDYKWTPNVKRLKTDAVPSVFEWKTPRKERKSPRKRLALDVRNSAVTVPEPEPEPEPLEQEEIPATPLQLAEETIRKLQTELKEKILQLEQKDRDIEKLEQALSLEKFGINRFSSDNSMISFYTGFPSYEIFIRVFKCIEPSALQMTSRYYVPSETISLAGRPRSMLLIDEFFMFLVRLRLGLFEQDIANRFNTSVQTISRKMITWANYLYFTLGSLPIWMSKEQIREHLPNCFRNTYPDTVVILDCTEIKTEFASSLVLNSQLYSSYKSSPTFKCLIGVAPHGAVTFVSNLFSGNMSDVEITKISGILDLLQPGDGVMADKGFTIRKLVGEKGAMLNIPPFLSNKGQFTESEVRETEEIASVRIHVERVIRRVKEFHFFDSPISLSLTGSINQIWAVACILTNFRGPIIAVGADKQ